MEISNTCAHKVAKYLLNASMTMNTNLSKGGSGGPPYSARVSYSARPESKGLYGKNPVAKMRVAMGIKMLAETRRSVELKVLVPAPS